MRKLLILSAATAALMSAGAAYADTMAMANRDLNVRAGPGTQNPVVGVIGSGQSVNILGCEQSGRWCTVAFDGGEGWVSAKYLSGDFDAGQVVVTEQPTAAIRTTRPATPGQATGVVTGGAAGAVTGAIVGGPVGAAVGGVAGVIAGGTAGTVLDPPARVRTYVSAHRMRPVYLQDDIAVGSSLPDTVELNEIPDYQYRYVYVNDRPMLVEPGSRRIVYVEQ
jgi:SH3-like domain-containing protein